MCKIPRILIVAPADKHLELRKALSSLEYDIAATVASANEALSIKADAVVAWEPDADALERLRAVGLKTVAVGGTSDGADMALAPDDIASFKTRIWELFRPS
jgi:hypothetical protein